MNANEGKLQSDEELYDEELELDELEFEFGPAASMASPLPRPFRPLPP